MDRHHVARVSYSHTQISVSTQMLIAALCCLLLPPLLQLWSATRCRATTTTPSSAHRMAPTTAPKQRSVARLATAWRGPACSPAWQQVSGAVHCHVASSWSHRHWQHQHHHHRHRPRQQQYQQHQYDLRSFPLRVALRQLIAHRAAQAAPAAQLPHIPNHIRIPLIPASIRRRWRSTEKVSNRIQKGCI